MVHNGLMKKNVMKIRGARVNNLKSVNIDLPLGKIVCFAGPSGSGKTSLAFHTVYNESKRRFLNSFPTYLKFFSDRPAPVDVDEIFPVLPVFALAQINPVVGTRSVVGDIMGLTDMFQSLFARHSREFCPIHKVPLQSIPFAQKLVDFIKVKKEADEKARYSLLVSNTDFLQLYPQGPFPSKSFDVSEEALRAFCSEDLYWEVAKFRLKSASKLQEQVAGHLERNQVMYLWSENFGLERLNFDNASQCPQCDYCGHDQVNPAFYSPYNALGACGECNGFGSKLEYDEEKIVNTDLSVQEGGVTFLDYKRFSHEHEALLVELDALNISLDRKISALPKKFWKILYEGKGSFCGLNELFDWLETKKYKPSVRIFVRSKQKEVLCNVCEGTRVNKTVKNFTLAPDLAYFDLWKMDLQTAYERLRDIPTSALELDGQKNKEKMVQLLKTAIDIGLGHLKLLRKVKTVSAGEYQRLLMVKHLSYEGTGALFIFDEPSLGLSLREKESLLKAMISLIAQGNSVFLIDHSEFFHKHCDHFVFIGPDAGASGGEVVFEGLYSEYEKGHKQETQISPLRIRKRSWVEVKSPSVYGKTFGDFKLPKNEITWVCGDSGSGKTAALVNVLANEVQKNIDSSSLGLEEGTAKKIVGIEDFKEVILVDANLNRYNSRSTFGSMSDMFSIVRKHFLKTRTAISLGLKDGHLSPNSQLGQCSTCEGRGYNIIEMQFLEDIELECEDCHGLKLKPQYAQLSDGHMTVAQAYSLPLESVMERVKLTPKYRRIYEYVKALHLDYVSLERTVNSLSGGEKQRLYLLSKLQKEIYGALVIMENLSFGLSVRELESVSAFLQKLSSQGNTIVLIDQNDFFSNVASHKVEFFR